MTATAVEHRQASKGVVALSVVGVILASPFYGLGVLIALIGAFAWLRGNAVARWALIGAAIVLALLVPYLIMSNGSATIGDAGPERIG